MYFELTLSLKCDENTERHSRQ